MAVEKEEFERAPSTAFPISLLIGGCSTVQRIFQNVLWLDH
ncbi:hypothetical protein OESDEN_06179 [Oesophagostomum dentatum]|uniref:Uncharacterized protein n=1 Tax=Oesophagostomum dentatum TaxID=61180 RepID=A0A0B1T8J0_OESDE|nr:hypothetical protein OESDEN_06179 [Oesophagostomum dentatum]